MMEWTGERYIPAMSGEIGCEHMNRYHFAVNQVDLTNKIILDIASGEGYGTNLLARHAQYTYGVDISNEAVDHAKKQYVKDNLTFIQGSAIAIPLPDKAVDVIVSFETIEHLAEHQEMISEMKRVLRKEGILIISSPDKLRFTDNTGDSNHFHIKELYYDEFKNLIKSNFGKAYFFNQKIFVGSIISLDEGYMEYGKPLLVDDNGNKSVFEPKYNIAVATDAENLLLNHTMINYTENNRMIIPQDLKHANYEGQLHVSNSLSYRMGSAIVSPFRKLGNLMNGFFAFL